MLKYSQKAQRILENTVKGHNVVCCILIPQFIARAIYSFSSFSERQTRTKTISLLFLLLLAWPVHHHPRRRGARRRHPGRHPGARRRSPRRHPRGHPARRGHARRHPGRGHPGGRRHPRPRRHAHHGRHPVRRRPPRRHAHGARRGDAHA